MKSLRRAKTEDAWRHLYRAEPGTRLTKFSFSGLRGFGDGIVDFDGPLTAICGGNGAGKTTLLAGIYGALRPVFSSSVLGGSRIEGASLRADVVVGGEPRIYEFNETTPDGISIDFDLQVEYVDPSFYGPHYIDLFSKMTHLGELLDGVEPSVLDQGELGLVSMVVGKEYSKCTVYELEMEDDVLPYFRVEYAGVEYGSESMGLGEICAHYVLWNIMRAPKGSIFLVEEPETFLSPKAQEALLNVLASYALQQRLCVVLTTHSPFVLLRVPSQHIRLVARAGTKTVVRPPVDAFEHLAQLGVKVRRSTIVLVEDVVAREFACQWIMHNDLQLLRDADIVKADGTEGITSLLCFPEVSDETIKIVGLFDADARDKLDGLDLKRRERFNWPYCFLPGSSAPEGELQRATYEHVDVVALALRKDPGEIICALAANEGADHHDWLPQMAHYLGKTVPDTVAAMFSAWIQPSENAKASAEAFAELQSLVPQEATERLAKAPKSPLARPGRGGVNS